LAVAATCGAFAGPAQSQDPISFVASALERYPVVELSRAHGEGNLSELELIERLFASPAVTAHLNDVVIECGNSRYQPVLDRYVSGGEVPLEKLQAAWRKTTQIIGCESDPSTKLLIDLVRNFNLRSGGKVRVLAADPPIDWKAIHTEAQFDAFLMQRDYSAASVIERQVLARHRRALVVIGGYHVTKDPSVVGYPTITMLLERHYPRSTYVIWEVLDTSQFDEPIRRTIASWPAPAIAPIAGTVLALQTGKTITAADDMRRVNGRWVPIIDAFPGKKLGQLVDAILYLGAEPTLRTADYKEPTDEPYASELKRMRAIAMGTPSPL